MVISTDKLPNVQQASRRQNFPEACEGGSEMLAEHLGTYMYWYIRKHPTQ